MDRLTRLCENTENGKYIPYVAGTYTGIYPDCTLGEVVERLAYYENLEEQDKLVILPCNVGQKLYTVYCYGFGKYQVHESTLCEIKMVNGIGFSFYEQRQDGWCYKVDVEQIGKSIFLSREEAEAAIRGELCFK